MAKTGIFHHVGTFLLLAAAVLLLITTISAPVINNIPILKVKLTNGTSSRHSAVSFGTFGHCVLNVAPIESDHDYCSGRHIGYNPALIMSQIEDVNFNTAAENTSKALTRVMVLHPVACGLAFIAFLLALGAGFCGAIMGAMVSAIAWVVTIVVMACDFTLFGIIKNKVNKDGTGHAYYSTGMWTVLAAMICLFFATFVVLFTCFSSRMHRQHDRTTKAEAGYLGTGTTRTTKRRFWQRRNRY